MLPDPEIPPYPFCKPVEDALQKQLQQERLLSQVVSQIHQSLELPVILATAVDEARRFLEVDRLLIYQLAPPTPELNLSFSSVISGDHRINKTGRIAYEALAHAEIISVLNIAEDDHCFLNMYHSENKYHKGFIQTINDTAISYKEFPCLLELMEKYQVRAKLIAPIVVQKELWGLLIANHCSHRQWEDHEQRFFGQIAEHLAIAINQAQLYAELQHQKDTLEKRVIERTQALYEALRVAESANRAKSEFLATMSHELRTPLTCVIGISSTLLRWSFSTENNKISLEKQRAYLQSIHDSGEHLLELIEEILELSRVESGRTTLKISQFSLSKLAYQMIHSFREKARLKGVELLLDNRVNSKLDKFGADERRIKQILFNILGNAIKFTPQGGQVILRNWVEGNTAIFQVEDTGIGIHEDHRSLLFQKFQQLDSPYNRQHQGMGIGLALSKQLVELHGGIIEVESIIDDGSTFTVRIPSQMPTKKNGTKINTDKSENSRLIIPDLPHKMCVVLIDESEENASLISDLLTAAGYQFVWLIEASSSLEQIKLLEPQVVLVNTNLLTMDSVEFIAKLRDNNFNHQIKIIAISQKVSGNKCYVAGANECLSKPIQPEELLDTINGLILGNED